MLRLLPRALTHVKYSVRNGSIVNKLHQGALTIVQFLVIFKKVSVHAHSFHSLQKTGPLFEKFK